MASTLSTLKEVRGERINDQYFVMEHPSGVTIYVYPHEGYTGAFAIFGAKVGSIDDNFRVGGGEFIQVPAGIAHFLEHKLFENEEANAEERYAKTGAQSNAFTAFDRTCYHFSCTENFDESFEILLDFVQSPYFTEATVQKEQGIIGQEISMYQDDPEWRVFFNLLTAVYHNHPVRIDIAGTEETIAEITADTLYKCYNAFYNPANMVIAVSGNITPERVAAIADRVLRPADPAVVERCIPDEPLDIVKPLVEQHFEVGVPLFEIGFKEIPGEDTVKDRIHAEILLHAIAGKATALYRDMLDSGLINQSFAMQYMAMPGMRLELFAGESRDPEKVCTMLCAEIDRLRAEGVSEEAFECSRRSVYGGLIASLASCETSAVSLTECHFRGHVLWDGIEAAAAATREDIQALLEQRLSPAKCAISIAR